MKIELSAPVEGELQFSLDEHDIDSRAGVLVHPWDRPSHFATPNRMVALVVGDLAQFENGEQERDGSVDWEIVIVDRDQFVEGLLAVLPEIRRA